MEQKLVFKNTNFLHLVKDSLHLNRYDIYPSDVLKLEELYIKDINFWPADLDTLYQFKNLKHLCFRQERGIIDLKTFTPLKSLVFLEVGGDYYSHSTTIINIGALKELPNLKKLRIEDFGEVDLFEIGNLSNLTFLDVGWGKEAHNAEKIGLLKNLNDLYLTEMDINTLNFLDSLDKTTYVDLSYLKIKKPFDIKLLQRFENRDYDDLMDWNENFY